MIINCPSCDTSYQIDPAVLGEQGRKVKCTGCGVRWFVARPVEEAASQPAAGPAPAGSPGTYRQAPEPEPFAAAPPVPAERQPSARGTGAIGWLGVTVALLLLTGAVVGRDQIVAAVPDALPLYQRLGLPVTVESNLVLRAVKADRLEEDGTPVLRVVGEIVNVGEASRDLPSLRVSLLDAGRHEIEFSISDPPVATLPAGGLTRFEARLLDPPAAAKDFKVTLDGTLDGR